MSSRIKPSVGADPASTDDALVRACLSGDAGAWGELIRRYGAYIYSVAIRAYRLDPAAAEEVFQDVCIRIYDGLAKFRGGEFRGWIRQVTISACQEHFRQQGRRAREVAIDDIDGPAEMRDLDTALDVRSAVDQLGDPCRTTITLAFFEDLTQAQTAKRLSVPEGTVAARISRCLARLRDHLRAAGQEKPDPGAS